MDFRQVTAPLKASANPFTGAENKSTYFIMSPRALMSKRSNEHPVWMIEVSHICWVLSPARDGLHMGEKLGGPALLPSQGVL